MRTVIALLVLIVPFAAQATCTREFILEGFSLWLDSDHDGRISVDEWNENWVVLRVCGPDPLAIVGETVMEWCDADGDGYLTAADYDAPNSCITRIEALMPAVCNKILDCQRFNPI